MTESGAPLPPRVVAFVRGHISSLLQLEALLLFVESGRDSRSATQLAGDMYVPVSALQTWLDGFVAGGFLELAEDGGYRLPDSEDVSALLHEVADAYVRRRISLGRLIFSPPETDSRTSFSDAFRLRKDR